MGTKKMEIETIAVRGSVLFAHTFSGCQHGSDGYDVTVKGPKGELLIGTTVDGTEMPDLVGPVLAGALKQHVEQGNYVCRLNPVEVLGIRGSLAERIAKNDWSPRTTRG